MVDGKWYTAVDGHVRTLDSDSGSEVERAEAAKQLATLASSEVENERMSRQNLIVEAGAGSKLVRMMMHGDSEEERWWASLALVQLTFGNERSIEKLVDASVLGKSSLAIKRWMIGDEAVEDAMVEDGERECVVRAAAMVLANEVAYSTDRIKYGAIHILTNIANKVWDVHGVIFAHGAVRRVVPICKSSNTPALVAAGVGLLTSLSYHESSRASLLKNGAIRVLEPIAKTEREDLNAVSANIARQNLRRYAQSVMVGLVRGWQDRRMLKKQALERKMKRLANFFGNLVFYKSFVIWVKSTRETIEQREKMKMSVRRLLNRTQVWALNMLQRYVQHRRAMYSKFDTAVDFHEKSVGARNLMFRMWIEYMRKEGAWWVPDDSVEDQVKEKCKNFLALMSGQWVGLCFDAWQELLAKKRRAMKRWQNSALYFGFGCWTDFMYTEGSWWEPDPELKRLLDEKCGKFLAAMSGNYVQTAFREWGDMVRKKKKASARWFNKCLTDAFDTWHDEVFVELYALYEEVQQKCSKVISLIAGDYMMHCFRLWKEDTEMNMKGKRFLNRIKNKPMVDAWDKWIDVMFEGEWWTPDDEMQAQLDSKCGHLIAMMSGDYFRVVFTEWHSYARKARKAMLRWKNQSMHHMWKEWIGFHEYEGWRRRNARKIKAKRRLIELQEGLWEWISIQDERKHRQSLVGDAILMWQNVGVIWAFRSLDEYAQLEIWRRAVIAKFRMRFEMRPAHRMLLVWADWADQQAHLKLLMHRIKNRWVVQGLRQWKDLVQNEKIAQRERLVGASPGLMRWLKRPMSNCFYALKEFVATENRNRLILKKMKYRMDNGCLFETFANWNLFVDVVVHERFLVLKAAVADTLRSGHMSMLLPALQREKGLFQRTNVRWNEFARTYMEDAVKEFCDEEADEVGLVYKRVITQRQKRETEAARRHLDPSSLSKRRSPSPNRRHGHSLSPQKEGGVGGAKAQRQIAPGYMGGNKATSGRVGRKEMARDGRHMKHELDAKERGLKEERRRQARAAARERERREQEGGGGRGGSAPLPKMGDGGAESLRDGQELSRAAREGERLPAIAGAGGDGEDWPWLDRRAVSFALGQEGGGVDGGVTLPSLVPQPHTVIF